MVQGKIPLCGIFLSTGGKYQIYIPETRTTLTSLSSPLATGAPDPVTIL
jgi:hypothetical protein